MGWKKIGLAVFMATCLSLWLFPLTGGEYARIRDIMVTDDKAPHLVYAQVTDGFTEETEAAILAGVPTSFIFQIDLYGKQPYHFDRKLSRKAVSHTIKYDNVKKVFCVTIGDRRDPSPCPDLKSAKQAMADLAGIPIIPLQVLSKGGSYYIRIKTKLDKVQLPFHAKYLFSPLSPWHFKTEWSQEDFLYG